MSERDELIGLKLVTELFIAPDGYASTRIRSDEEAADLVIEWIGKRGYQRVPEGITWEAREASGYLSPVGFLIINPIFEFEKAKARRYHRVVGSTPWELVGDDDK